MASLAFSLPLLPGQTERWRQWSTDLAGPLRAQYRASRERLGVVTERAYLQHTPQGDIVLVYLEAPDLERTFAGIATSQEPFDVAFRETAKALWGVDLAQPPSAPFSELVFDGMA